MDLHATFHHAAGEVMALSLARKRGEALAAMETPSTFKQASDKLVAALTAWSDSRRLTRRTGAEGGGGEGGI